MIRLGTVGTSRIAKQFLTALKQDTRFVHAAVYSRCADTGTAFAEEMGCMGNVYTDFERFATANELDAVYVASPNGCHFEQCKRLLECGKHVLCEKPITLTADEYAYLRTLAKNKGVVLMEAIMSRHSPAYEPLHAAVARIGTPAAARLDFSQRSSRYDAYAAGETPNIFNISLGAGALMDLGVYCVWAAVDLFGKPKRIQACASFGREGVDLAGSALFEYDGFTATLTYAKTGQTALRSEIIGDDATVTLGWISTYSEFAVLPTHGEREESGHRESVVVMEGEIAHFADYIARPAEDYERLCDQTAIVRECMDEIARKAGIVYRKDGK